MIDCKSDCKWYERCDAASGFKYHRETCPTFERAESHVSMTNQETMSKLSPEEFYRKMYWLMFHYGCQFNNTELAIIDWLKQEADI